MKNLFKISFLASIVSLYLNNSASAQLIPDQSLGNESSIVNSTNNLLQIQGGATRGNNLFHSFREFNVNTNQEVFFNNSINIESIFTRVTGGNISNIDGLVSNVGQADLFILNPAGIVFGKNAQLNLGGSLFVTTAESILFADHTEFSTNNVNSKPLLTVTAPIGLRLNNPGKIVNQANLIKEERFGDQQLPTIFPAFRKDLPLEEKIVNTLVGLEVNPNQNITLVGGDIELNGGGLTALGGKIQVGGLAYEGIIKIDPNGNLVFPNNTLLSNISLINDASIDVQGEGRGDIIITGQTVILKDGSSLFAGIRPFKGSINSQAGDIVINGTDSVIFDGVRSQNSQRGGSNFPTNATNQIGLAFEKELKTESKGFDFIVNGKGQGGNIEINTKKLDITNGAKIVSLNYGEGNTGNIIINTEESISINSPGSSIFNTIFIGQGNAGNIEIKTKSLNLTQNATISENIFKGNGKLGNIIINAKERVFIDSNSSIFNTINKDGIGNGGIIKLKSKNVFLTNKGQLFTSTAGKGDAGNVTIIAQENININNGSISSEVLAIGNGQGGTIQLNSNNLIVTEQGALTVSSKGNGNVGQILIKANSVELDNQAKVEAETNFYDSNNSSNNSINNIFLDINGILILKNNSLISAKATQQANGGNAQINADFILAFPQNNDIIASAEQGQGGNINISTNAIFGIKERPAISLNNTNDIDASSQFGLNGNISIDILESDPAQSLTELPENIVDGSRLITKSCLAGDEKNEFVATGRGGLPTNPNESLRGDAVLSAEWLSLEPSTNNLTNRVEAKDTKALEVNTNKIVEAQGWIIGDNGNVILTAASNPKTTTKLPWFVPHDCSR